MTPSPSTQPSGMIAGGGFAVMAWKEAKRRTPDNLTSHWTHPLPRRVQGASNGASAEFYRILDNAWELFRPGASQATRWTRVSP